MHAAFALILVSLAAGYVVARFRGVPKNAADVLNRVVIYVCLPAVVLRLVPGLAWQPGLFVLVLVPWALLGSSLAVAAAARVARFPRGVKGALLVCVPLGNTSFLGFPMVGALLGKDAVRFAVIYDQLGTFLILVSYGLFVVARFSGGAPPNLRSVATRIVKFPPFIALVVALVPFSHPAALDAVLRRIGDTLVPIAMFAVGLRLEFRRPKNGSALAFGLAAKMFLLPLAAWVLTRALGAPPLPARVAVLEAAMPPMITAGALASMAGLAPELCAALVGYGVLLSLVTLPAIASLLG